MPSAPIGPVGHIVRLNVRRLREVRGLSLQKLSNGLGEVGHPLVPSGLGRLELGERRVDVDDLVALAKVFDVPPVDLLEPWDCDVCHGQPPAGFTCSTCGANGGTADRPGFSWDGGRR